MPRLLTLLALATILSCAHAGHPTAPPPANPGRLPVAIDADGIATGALGVFTLHLDAVQGTASLTPLRRGNSTDALETVDITNFLTQAPCTDCAKVMGIHFDSQQHVVVRIGIRHPFPAGDPMAPIQGANRGDLHVFNVEGIVFDDGPSQAFPGIGQVIAAPHFIDPDGYTGYLDGVIDPIHATGATIHPYRLHWADYSNGNFDPSYPMGFLSVTNPAPYGHLVMPMGSAYDSRDYTFDVSTGPLDFYFAVGCTYGVSADKRADRFNPVYRLPQFNKKAASWLQVLVRNDGLIAGNTGSGADLEVDVVDMSQGVPVGPGLDQMTADSSVAQVSVEVPGVTSAPVILPGSAATGGVGHDPIDPLIFPVTLTNDLGAAEGTYRGLVKVLDSAVPGQNQMPALQGEDAIQRVSPGSSPLGGLFSIAEFATYQVFTIAVAPVSNPPPIWPQTQGDRGHTGSLGLVGPGNDQPTADFHSVWHEYGNPLPIFLSNDTIYTSNTGDGGALSAVAINISDGSTKWTRIFHNEPQNWLNVKGISADGQIVICDESNYNTIYGLHASDGSEAWHLTGTIRVDTYATLDPQGNFIVPIQGVGYESISPAGSVNWVSPVGDPWYCTPAVGPDGTVYGMEGFSEVLHAMDQATGLEHWQTPSLGSVRPEMGVTVHPNGTILAYGKSALYCFIDQGTSALEKWHQPYNRPYYGSVGVGPSGDIYTIDYDGTFRRMDPETGLTTASTTGWSHGYAARPAFSKDGLIYLSIQNYDANTAYFSCFNPDCTLRWQFYGGQWWTDGLFCAGAIGQDGTVYSSYRKLGVVGFRD